jgi:apolipoprotein N-acyltransferase
MVSNFFPKNIFRGKNADGSKFTVKEYDFETIAHLDFARGFLMLFSGAIIGVFLAPLLFVLSVLSFDGFSKIKFWVVMLISGYVLFDFTHGWLMLRLLDFFFEEPSLNVLFAINTGVFVSCIVMILVGSLLYRWIIDINNTVGSRWLFYVIVVCVMFFIGYNIGKSNIKNDVGWVREILGFNEKTPSEIEHERVGNMTDQQIEDEAQKRYEDQLRKEGKDPANYR